MGYRQPLRVDPRIFVSEGDITGASAIVLSAPNPGVVEERARVLERWGAIRSDAVEDFRCQGLGTPIPPSPEPRLPVPDSSRERFANCIAKGSYTSLVLGIPRPGGPYYPPGGIDAREDGRRKGYWTVRVLSSSSVGFVGYDVVLAPDAGRWGVVEWRPLYGAIS
jgi:hypothetical protein